MILGISFHWCLFVEGLAAGLNCLLEAHVDGTNELFDVQIGKFTDLITRFDVVAEVYCVTWLNVVFMAILVALIEEGNEVQRRSYPQMEELYDLQVAQVLTLLDGLPDALCNNAHLHVQLQQLQ